MPFLVPDFEPPTWKQRGKAVGLGLLLAAVALFLFWHAPHLAAPDWKPSGRRWRFVYDWAPFWRGAFAAIIGSWLAVFSLVVFWKAVRPFTPDWPDRYVRRRPRV